MQPAASRGLIFGDGGIPACVEEATDPRVMRAHIRYVRARSRNDADQFAGLMLRWAWPSGHDDHYDPVLAEGLKRLPPRLVCEDVADCGCTDGRCTLCN